ncbi:uncharacterized protein [Rhodnius prolixus]|uniref:uncharacterized protein n=1 Tax=Rhodnius prolixus TaxID=13249 RepID=UPI003D18B2C5
MALPAGCSSDEGWGSYDDEITFANNFCEIKKVVPELDKKSILTQEQKLIDAIREEKFNEVQELLENGADINYKPENYGWSPLMHAATLGLRDIIELLLKKGANPNIQVKLTTPLMCLCDSSTTLDEDELLLCFNLLVDAGANVNAFNVNRETSMMYAADRGHDKLLTRLLELDCDVDFTNCDGWTAIFFAVNRGYLKIVKLLKAAGANLSLEDLKGQTLYDLASIKNYKEIADEVTNNDDIDTMDYFYPNSLNKNMSNFQFVLSEMPNYEISHFNGFYEDTLTTIAGLDMHRLIPLFIEKKIGYGQFLTNLDNDWKKLGVEISCDRKRLINFSYDIIQKNWSTDAFIDHRKESASLFRISQKLCNMVRIVHILVATSYVTKREWNKQPCFDNRAKLKEVLKKTIHEIKSTRANIAKISEIFQIIDERSDKFPADFVGPKTQSKQVLSHFLHRYSFYICFIVSFLGVHFFFKKSLNGLKGLLKVKIPLIR